MLPIGSGARRGGSPGREWHNKTELMTGGRDVTAQREADAEPQARATNLLGWVTSAIFAAYYALNPAKAEGRLPMVHYGIYIVGVVIMSGALYMLLSGNAAMEPVVAGGSLIVLAGVLVFAFVVFTKASAVAGATPGRLPAE